jgi:hypothetical protein
MYHLFAVKDNYPYYPAILPIAQKPLERLEDGIVHPNSQFLLPSEG